MKKRNLIVVLALLSFISCESIEDLDNPTFDVLNKDVVVNVGDTLAFDFKGNADIVTFYSGEFGQVYDYRNRTEREFEGNIKLSFTTSVQNSYIIDPFPRELDAFISSDFNGDLNYANIVSASSNWKPINNLTFPLTSADLTLPAIPVTPTTPDGKLDITNLVEIGKSFYIAFRYKSTNRMATSTGHVRNAREWRVDALSLINEQPEGASVLMSQSSAGWQFVNRADSEIETGRGGSLNNSGRISIRGNQLTTYQQGESIEIWAISNPISTGMAKIEPDRGVTIKNISRNRLESHTHIYNKPGVYKAVFVVANSNIYGHQSVVKEVNVTVKP